MTWGLLILLLVAFMFVPRIYLSPLGIIIFAIISGIIESCHHK